jgi:hypothetical protein
MTRASSFPPLLLRSSLFITPARRTTPLLHEIAHKKVLHSRMIERSFPCRQGSFPGCAQADDPAALFRSSAQRLPIPDVAPVTTNRFHTH